MTVEVDRKSSEYGAAIYRRSKRLVLADRAFTKEHKACGKRNVLAC